MAIKFSQFNLRTDSTPTMFLVGYDGNQNIHITVDNLISDIIDGTENTIAMFGPGGHKVIDSMVTQNAGATLLTVAGQLNVDADATFDTSITVTGASTLNGNVILGNESADLITQTGTLYLNGPVKDTTDTLGIEDQILVSDVSGELTFTDLADISVGSAEVVEVPVKNLQGSALTKGDPVYISGDVGASGKLEVKLADASNAAKMPALGLLKQDLGINEEGFAVVTGKLRNLVTDPIDGQPSSANDVIYVKAGGTTGAALTLTKPVGTDLIQNMGKVGRASTSNDGTFVVSSILRTNDIPNLTPGKIWVGSTGNTIESSSITFTEATGAVQLDEYGTGTITGTPAYNLSVDASGNVIETDTNTTYDLEGVGNANGTAGVRLAGSDTTNDDVLIVGAGTTGVVRAGNTLTVTSNDQYTGTVTGTGVATRVAFWNGTSSLSSNADLYWDNTNSRLGIGTEIPGSKLEVMGDTSSALLTLKSYSGGSNDSFMRFYDESNGPSYSVGLDSSDAKFKIAYNSDGNSLTTGTKLVMDTSGSVGIGTTFPSTKLDVSGDTSGTLLTLKSLSGGTNDAAMRFYDESNGPAYVMGLDSSDEKFKIAFDYDNNSVSSGTKLTIDTSGNVGIGTTGPSQKLHVNGSALVTSNLYIYNTSFYIGLSFGRIDLQAANGVNVRSGTTYKPVYASAFTVSSDYRLKSNIVPLENAISRVNQLEVHRFNWNDRLNEPKVDGFIAHEVSSVVPEAVLGEKDAVHEDGTPNHQGIDQAKIVPLLTAALQEAIAKIESLESRIQTLENQ